MRKLDPEEKKRRKKIREKNHYEKMKHNSDFKMKRIKNAIKYKYGISLHDYLHLLIEQDYCCKICKRHKDNFKKRLFIDHCHETGKVRGLLCPNCNTFLGAINDNPDLSDYIREYLKCD